MLASAISMERERRRASEPEPEPGAAPPPCAEPAPEDETRRNRPLPPPPPAAEEGVHLLSSGPSVEGVAADGVPTEGEADGCGCVGSPKTKAFHQMRCACLAKRSICSDAAYIREHARPCNLRRTRE